MNNDKSPHDTSPIFYLPLSELKLLIESRADVFSCEIVSNEEQAEREKIMERDYERSLEDARALRVEDAYEVE